MMRNSLFRSKAQNAIEDAITCIVMVALVAFMIWVGLSAAYWFIDHFGKAAHL